MTYIWIPYNYHVNIIDKHWQALNCLNCIELHGPMSERGQTGTRGAADENLKKYWIALKGSPKLIRFQYSWNSFEIEIAIATIGDILECIRIFLYCSRSNLLFPNGRIFQPFQYCVLISIMKAQLKVIWICAYEHVSICPICWVHFQPSKSIFVYIFDFAKHESQHVVHVFGLCVVFLHEIAIHIDVLMWFINGWTITLTFSI